MTDKKTSATILHEIDLAEEELGKHIRSGDLMPVFKYSCTECGTPVWQFTAHEDPVQCCPTCRRQHSASISS